MTPFERIKRLLKDPPPEYAFEISPEGLAWTATAAPSSVQLVEFPDGLLRVNPVKPNFADPAALAQLLERSIPKPSHPAARLAVLALPDYCARVAVLDFDSFPAEAAEQLALVRFRMKRIVPFDIEDAVVACYPQPRKSGSKGLDVVVVTISREIASQYTQPFHHAGFQCGLITISGLAALSLEDSSADGATSWLQVKLAGHALTTCLVEQSALRMFRCVELDHATVDEMMDILGPTLAYAEDELSGKPERLRLCGFGGREQDGENLGARLGLTVTRVTSPFGAASAGNAGLLGLLATSGVN